jgi:hypothetical protein
LRRLPPLGHDRLIDEVVVELEIGGQGWGLSELTEPVADGAGRRASLISVVEGPRNHERRGVSGRSSRLTSLLYPDSTHALPIEAHD